MAEWIFFIILIILVWRHGGWDEVWPWLLGIPILAYVFPFVLSFALYLIQKLFANLLNP
jgi:hypothetical protein